MPFLFVDYDQGAGGEYLSYVLSRAPQSVELKFFKTKTNRYKVFDCFDHEFLKTVPMPQPRTADPVRFEIVPCHRQVDLAKQLLNDVRSIRIKNPADEQLWDYIKHNQLIKTLLSKEETVEFFVGEVELLSRSSQNPNFLKEINHRMDRLDLRLVAQGLAITEENRKTYIDNLSVRLPEPDTAYDLVILYEDLVLNPCKVQQDLKEIFDLDVDPDLLQAYKTNYENRTS